jgi:hypothetical protein
VVLSVGGSMLVSVVSREVAPLPVIAPPLS